MNVAVVVARCRLRVLGARWHCASLLRADTPASFGQSFCRPLVVAECLPPRVSFNMSIESLFLLHIVPRSCLRHGSFWMRGIIGGLCVVGMITLNTAKAAEPEEAAPTDFFEMKIRPVLVEHCYECHSVAASESGKLRGKLLLDSRDAMRSGGESGPAVVPGDLDASLIIAALRYEAFEMPPAGKLSDNVISDFERWIREGAIDPREGAAIAKSRTIDIEAGKKFWSFQPLAKVVVPDEMASSDDNNVTVPHPIDRFIIEKQKWVGLTMSPIASPRILIRRAWFDLLGIPPTPDEMQEWLRRLSQSVTGRTTVDQQAWEELIEYLLDRPEYGERWARHWMDIARFAESYGYEQDYDRPNAYHYRDFLIRAFNSDMPFDQFVQWQLAGDELEPSNPEAWMATGFLSAGAFPTQLTETEFESTRYNELDDMVSTTSLAFLGLSIGCARCHDHKFDPISAVDYYRMAGVFTSAIRCESAFDLDPEQNRAIREQHQSKLELARDELRQFETQSLPAQFFGWLKSSSSHENTQMRWRLLDGELKSSGGTSFQKLGDGSFLAMGDAPQQEVLTFETEGVRGDLAVIRVEALEDASLPRRGPGRADNGNFALGDFQVAWIEPQGQLQPIALASAAATHEQNRDSLSVAASIDSDPVSGWAIDGQIGQSQAGVFRPSTTMTWDGERRFRLTLVFNHPNGRHAMGRLRFSISSDPNATPVIGDQGPPDQVLACLERLRARVSDIDAFSAELLNDDWKVGIAWYQAQMPQWIELNAKAMELEKSGPALRMTNVQVTSEGLPILPHHANDRGYPHHYPETFVLRRGDVTQRVEVAEPGFPKVLTRGSDPWRPAPLSEQQDRNPKSSYRRAALATWLTDPNEGTGALAARVIVNRLWQHHFGAGIVTTPNDFGATGQPPSHPMLLEWLASQLVAEGWRLKPLHRSIMTSGTYMQSNRLSNDSRSQIDLENRLLWHRPPRRLEAEAIRDSVLAVSGLLDRRMYGPGTLDPNMKRRSVYFFIKRSELIPSMMLFDWPEHLASVGQRQSTTVAPQALLFMNNPQTRECAEALAAAVLKPELGETIRLVFDRTLGRPPTDREQIAALEFIGSDQRVRDGTGGTSAIQLAVADFCQMVFSMNEFIYVD